MPTQKQIAANRRNAQKSTGPRTPEGKARSAMNALRSGIDAKSQIIWGETPGELDALRFEYQSRFCPATPAQRMLVDTLVDCEWLLRRFRRVEAQLWDEAMNGHIHKSILGEVYRKNCDIFARLQRRIDSTQRHYRQALEDLERRQAAEAVETEPDPASEPAVSPEAETANPENGSDPQSLPVAERPESEDAHKFPLTSASISTNKLVCDGGAPPSPNKNSKS